MIQAGTIQAGTTQAGHNSGHTTQAGHNPGPLGSRPILHNSGRTRFRPGTIQAGHDLGPNGTIQAHTLFYLTSGD